MVILISGATHTGKTLLAQRLMEEHKIPYFSIDHLKMGLIRSGQTHLSVYDDAELVPYLWSIVKEMIKTAIENDQNLIVEGCYVPFDWKKDFDNGYLSHIKYLCIVMSRSYIENNFDEILKYENSIENRRGGDVLSLYDLIEENEQNLAMCKKYGQEYILIDEIYDLKSVKFTKL